MQRKTTVSSMAGDCFGDFMETTTPETTVWKTTLWEEMPWHTYYLLPAALLSESLGRDTIGCL